MITNRLLVFCTFFVVLVFIYISVLLLNLDSQKPVIMYVK